VLYLVDFDQSLSPPFVVTSTSELHIQKCLELRNRRGKVRKGGFHFIFLANPTHFVFRIELALWVTSPAVL
jgi:hypothetical protein